MICGIADAQNFQSYWLAYKLSQTCNCTVTEAYNMNSMKLVIPLRSMYWSIHTKDESRCGTAFAFIFGVN